MEDIYHILSKLYKNYDLKHKGFTGQLNWLIVNSDNLAFKYKITARFIFQKF